MRELTDIQKHSIVDYVSKMAILAIIGIFSVGCSIGLWEVTEKEHNASCRECQRIEEVIEEANVYFRKSKGFYFSASGVVEVLDKGQLKLEVVRSIYEGLEEHEDSHPFLSQKKARLDTLKESFKTRRDRYAN